MDKTIVAVDPGGKGFVTVRHEGDFSFIPIADCSREELARMIGMYGKRGHVVAVMEEVHAVFGSSAKSTFNFGEVFGFLKGILIAGGIPYHLVQPKDWQREIWINEDKIYRYKGDGKRVIDTKGTSLNAAIRLFPEIDFRRTAACKRPDDNKVDSLLICEYARRRNL